MFKNTFVTFLATFFKTLTKLWPNHLSTMVAFYIDIHVLATFQWFDG